MRGGVYTAWIQPRNSGTGENNRIWYARYRNERVEISGTKYAILLDGASYITVTGIECRNLPHHRKSSDTHI
jgi:hypothetical protein